MPQDAAETARTLADGHLPGSLTMCALADSFPATYATTTAGELLLAARKGSRLARALEVTGDGATVELTVDDALPYPESPWLGRVRIRGRVSRVPGEDLYRAGLDFAAVNPVIDLLELGGELDLARIDPVAVTLEGPEAATVDPARFLAAEPDPLHSCEGLLLQDLRTHHRDDLGAFAPPGAGRPMAVRLDRHGIVLDLPGLHRFEFPEPADCPSCVSRMLRLNHVDHP